MHHGSQDTEITDLWGTRCPTESPPGIYRFQVGETEPSWIWMGAHANRIFSHQRCSCHFSDDCLLLGPQKESTLRVTSGAIQTCVT